MRESVRRTWTRARRGARIYPLGTIVVIMQTVAAAAVAALLFIGQGQKVPFISSDRYEIQVAMDDAGGLKEAKQPLVTVAGVPHGLVKEVRYEDGRALATLELDSEVSGKVYEDARALVVPRSALNDVTLDVDPGSPNREALPEGGVIPPSRVEGKVDLDRVTEVLNADTRAHLQVLVDQLDIGLQGRSRSLAEALRELGPFLDPTQRVASALAERRRLLSDLVHDLDVMFSTLGERGTDLRDAIVAGQESLGTVGRRQRELADAMRQLAPALSSTTGAMNELNRLAVPLNPAIDRLRPFAAELPVGLRALREFVPSGRGLMRDLDRLSREGGESVLDLRALLGELGPASTELTPSVRRLLPVVKAINRHRHGIGKLGSGFSGIFSGQNWTAPTLRAYGFFEPIRPENFGAPGAQGAELAELETNLVFALRHVCLNVNVVACLARYLVPGLPGSIADQAIWEKGAGQ